MKRFVPFGVVTCAVVLAVGSCVAQQSPTPATDLPAGTTSATAADQAPPAVATTRNTRKVRKTAQEKREERVKVSKDTAAKQKADRKFKANPLADVTSTQPDKQLYDKALEALKKGRYEVARLDLQTLLSTYQDSEYQMRAKLAFADSWYREGGSAALAQAEAEYHDFIVFFPNAPEAAEAQMRIGDIYYKQMDRPDRDYTKAIHAQEEYRTMLTQYPDSTLVTEAKQRLREVQEALATRETDIAQFYAGHENWSATIARFQTIVDTYPLYSHLDVVLIGLGDAYAAESRNVRAAKLPEDARARLLKVYDDAAAAAYGRVVTQYAASTHVEDARDRLEAMSAPIPTPTAEQIAASQALEDSRQAYTLSNRAKGLFLRGPDVIQAARIGEPALSDPKATLAPQVNAQNSKIFTAAITAGATPAAIPALEARVPATTTTDATPATPSGTPATASVAPTTGGSLSLQDIPSADAPTASGAAVNAGTLTGTPTTATGTGNTVGVTILSTTGGSGGASESAPRSDAPGPPLNTPGPPPAGSAQPNYGLPSVRPANNALPAIERAGDAPDAVNDVANVRTPASATPPPPGKNGKRAKNPKTDYDKDVESSSAQKKKKGLGKINPF